MFGFTSVWSNFLLVIFVSCFVGVLGSASLTKSFVGLGRSLIVLDGCIYRDDSW
jgi:hypothetical protein